MRNAIIAIDIKAYISALISTLQRSFKIDANFSNTLSNRKLRDGHGPRGEELTPERATLFSTFVMNPLFLKSVIFHNYLSINYLSIYEERVYQSSNTGW